MTNATRTRWPSWLGDEDRQSLERHVDDHDADRALVDELLIAAHAADASSTGCGAIWDDFR